jgi:hypothetical protein
MVGVARKRAIAALEQARPDAFGEYQRDRRLSEAGNQFARASGRFNLTARGKVNTYALFSELAFRLTNNAGRSGLIVPTGIATDDTTKEFFDQLVQKGKLVSLLSMYEVRQWFTATYDRKSFCLIVMGTTYRDTVFAFNVRSLGELLHPEKRFSLTPDQIAEINPNTKTAPTFRSRRDATLASEIYGRMPVLIDETLGASGNPWDVDFRQGLFNMTSDSGRFQTAKQLAEAGYVRDGTDWVRERGASSNPPLRYTPLYEAKMINLFDPRWATFDGNEIRAVADLEKALPTYSPLPQYWVPRGEVVERLSRKGWSRGWLLGWRDIALAAVERTVICCALPAYGVNHKLPLIFSKQPICLQVGLLANICALVLDYVARQKIGGTSLTYFYLKQFPVLPPSAYSSADLAFVTPRVLELTYTSHSMAPFARDLGYSGPPFAWDEDRRPLLRAELDAFYAKKYGLTRDELRYILDPADVMGSDYPSETFRVLKTNEIKKHGEYRTARLVLAAWDRMERGELTMPY